MKLAVAFFAFATLCGIAAACLAQWVTPVLLPQVGLLAIAAWSYRSGGSQSLLAAWAVGWSFDSLSAAVPGTHPFLFLLAWMVTRFASHQVHLRSAAAFGLYLFVLTLGLTLVASLSLGQPQLSARLIGPALLQALVNALAAGPLRWAQWALLERFGEGEPVPSTGLSSGAVLS